MTFDVASFLLGIVAAPLVWTLLFVAWAFIVGVADKKKGTGK